MVTEFRTMSEKRKHEEGCNQSVIRPAKIIRTITTSGHITTWPDDGNNESPPEDKEAKKEINEDSG